MTPVTLTLKQGQVNMYVFGGLVVIHHHVTFGVDRLNSIQEKSNVKVFYARTYGRTDARTTHVREHLDSLLLCM